MNISDSGYNLNISGIRPAGGQGTQNIQNQDAAQNYRNHPGRQRIRKRIVPF